MPQTPAEVQSVPFDSTLYGAAESHMDNRGSVYSRSWSRDSYTVLLSIVQTRNKYALYNVYTVCPSKDISMQLLWPFIWCS